MVDPRHTQRRQVIKSIAAGGSVGLVAVAGCLGDDNDDPPADDTDDTDDAPADDDDDPPADDADDYEDLEDELTLYSTTSYEAVYAVFEEEYGVTVNESVYTGPEVTSRFTAEAEAGDLQADVSIQSLQALTWDSVRPHLAEIEIDNEDALITDDRRDVLEERDSYGLAWPIVTLPYTAPFNTGAVDEPASTWEDFLEPEWEGRLATPMVSMRAAFSMFRQAGWDDDEILEYLVDLDENIAEYTAAAPPTVEAIIGGQFDHGWHMAGHMTRPAIDQGAPLSISYPEFTLEHHNAVGLTGEEFNTAPNASRAFVQWITSQEGQETIQDELNFKPGDPSMDHGHDYIQQQLEEQDPDLVPAPYSEQEADEIDEILNENIDRVSL